MLHLISAVLLPFIESFVPPQLSPRSVVTGRSESALGCSSLPIMKQLLPINLSLAIVETVTHLSTTYSLGTVCLVFVCHTEIPFQQGTGVGTAGCSYQGRHKHKHKPLYPAPVLKLSGFCGRYCAGCGGSATPGRAGGSVPSLQHRAGALP